MTGWEPLGGSHVGWLEVPLGTCVRASSLAGLDRLYLWAPSWHGGSPFPTLLWGRSLHPMLAQSFRFACGKQDGRCVWYIFSFWLTMKR